LQSYLKKLQDEGKGDSKDAKMITKMTEDFDKLSNGSDKITVDSMKTGMESLRPKGGKPPQMDSEEMFSDLLKKVGADDNGITKDDLQNYLKKLQYNGDNDSKEADLINKMLKDFNSISGGTDNITASSMQKAFEGNQNSTSTFASQEWQDPSTITYDQLQPPIDIKV